MGLIYHCESCKAAMRIKERQVGSLIKCPKCEHPQYVDVSSLTRTSTARRKLQRVSARSLFETPPTDSEAAEDNEIEVVCTQCHNAVTTSQSNLDKAIICSFCGDRFVASRTASIDAHATQPDQPSAEPQATEPRSAAREPVTRQRPASKPVADRDGRTPPLLPSVPPLDDIVAMDDIFAPIIEDEATADKPVPAADLEHQEAEVCRRETIEDQQARRAQHSRIAGAVRQVQRMRLHEMRHEQIRRQHIGVIVSQVRSIQQVREDEFAARVAAEELQRNAEQLRNKQAERIRREEETRRRAAAEKQRLAAEEKRKAAEAAKRRREEAERQRLAAEEKRKAEEEAQLRRLAAEAERKAEEERWQRLAAEVKRDAEEKAKREREEAERQRLAAEAQRKAEEEAQRRREEEEQRRLAAEAKRKAEEEAQRRREEEERQRLAAEAKRKADEAARRQREEEKRRRLAAAEHKRREEEARRKAEEEQRRKAEQQRARLRETIASLTHQCDVTQPLPDPGTAPFQEQLFDQLVRRRCVFNEWMETDRHQRREARRKLEDTELRRWRMERLTLGLNPTVNGQHVPPVQRNRLGGRLVEFLLTPVGVPVAGCQIPTAVGLCNSFRLAGCSATVSEKVLAGSLQQARLTGNSKTPASGDIAVGIERTVPSKSVRKHLEAISRPNSRQRLAAELFWLHLSDEQFAVVREIGDVTSELVLTFFHNTLETSNGQEAILARHALAVAWLNVAIARESAFAAGQVSNALGYWDLALEHWMAVTESEEWWQYLADRGPIDMVTSARETLPQLLSGLILRFARAYGQQGETVSLHRLVSVLRRSRLPDKVQHEGAWATVRAGYY